MVSKTRKLLILRGSRTAENARKARTRHVWGTCKFERTTTGRPYLRYATGMYVFGLFSVDLLDAAMHPWPKK